MSENRRKIVLLSGSPKVDQSWAVSAFLAKRGADILQDEDLDIQTIEVRHALLHHETESAFAELSNADAIIIVFPLYFFCMPAMLTRFLQDFTAAYPRATNESNVYAIINCGFPEPEINGEAMQVIGQFAKKTGRTFLGGVLLGCGGMILGAKNAPFMSPVFNKIDAVFMRVKNDLLTGNSSLKKTELAAAKFPRALYFLGGNVGWKSMARKNKLKPKDLYRRPYEK